MSITQRSSFPGVTRRERQMALDIAFRLGLPPIAGRWIFVDNYIGDDDNNGLSPDRPKKTLYNGTTTGGSTGAYNACVTSRGDGICILSRSTTSSTYSATISAGFTWDKYGITVYGVCARGFYNQRARIAFAAATTDVYNFNLTAHNCSFENVSFVNQNDVSNAQITTVKLAAAHRNAFINCDFKCSPATASAYKCDIWFSGAHENLFSHCNFGNASYDAGNNAACHIYMDGTTGNAQNMFEDCTFIAQVSTGTAFGALKLGNVAALNGTMIFKHCLFNVWQANTGLTAMTSWYIGSNPTTGNIFVFHCGSNGYAAWDSAGANDNVVVCNANGATAEIAAAGIGVLAS